MTEAAVRPKGFHLATGLFPGAVVVSNAKPLTDEWFAARRAGITATDIPRILGESEYGNAISVWMDKRGEWDEEAGEAAEWGHEFEEPIAKVWARRNNTHVAKVEMLGKRGAEWMRANLDRVVRACPTGETSREWACALEVKLRNAFVAGSWRDDMPDDVLAQVAWQRMVTGAHHIHVGANIGGQRLVQFTYYRDVDLEDFILAKATQVWQHIQDGTQPTAEPNALLTRVLNKLHPNRRGVIELPLDGLAPVDRYETARVEEAAAKRRKEAAKAEMVLALGDNDVALVGDKPAYSYLANAAGTRTIRIEPAYRKEHLT